MSHTAEAAPCVDRRRNSLYFMEISENARIPGIWEIRPSRKSPGSKQVLSMVKYYAFQVKTRAENKFIRLFKALHPEVPFPLYFPQRRIDIRRRGVIRQSTAAVFPGYVFAEVDDSRWSARCGLGWSPC